jgi:hypothetical protein
VNVGTDERTERAFAAEVARLRAGNVPGESGRLRELFDFLADRGADAAPASQAEIADTVFGQPDVAGDDATVRVYIHRLRKRLEEHYAAHPGNAARLTVPPGAYVLRFIGPEAEMAAATPAPSRRSLAWLAAGALLLLLVVAALFIGRTLAPSAPPANSLWQPFLASERPLTIVLGDYYIFGEIDEVRPEEGRLIRDFRINSPTDLARAQETDPERYGAAEDVGLNYLPFSSAYALRELMPVLARAGRRVEVIPASQLEADTLRNSDIIYLGLISGMGLLEDTVIRGSGYQVGESYDELIDRATGKVFVSEEARRLASPVFYRDYAYVARFRAPGGALVAVVAGARETGLRGVAPLLSGDLPDGIAELAEDGAFEALFEVTGQQGADLSERLIAARARP